MQYEDGTQSSQIDSLMVGRGDEYPVWKDSRNLLRYDPRPPALLAHTELKRSFRYPKFDEAVDKMAAVKARCPHVLSLYVAMRKSGEVTLSTLRRHWRRVPREQRIDLIAILNQGAWARHKGSLEPVTGTKNPLWVVYYFIAQHLHGKLDIAPYIAARR